MPSTFNGRTSEELLNSGEWAWHDLKTAVRGPEDSLSVWTWNGKSTQWGVGNSVDVQGDGLVAQKISINAPEQWISNITFLSENGSTRPREIVLHVVNSTDKPMLIFFTSLLASTEWRDVANTVRRGNACGESADSSAGSRHRAGHSE